MKPTRDNYRVVEADGGFAVQHKYDLMTGYDWHTNPLRFEKSKDAFNHTNTIFESHLREYERLKNMGRSFPDND